MISIHAYNSYYYDFETGFHKIKFLWTLAMPFMLGIFLIDIYYHTDTGKY